MQAARTGSGNAAGWPVSRWIHTITTLPSQYSALGSSAPTMRWPTLRLVLPRRSTNSSMSISFGHSIGRR